MEHPPSVIFFCDGLDAGELESFALRLEDLGYESLWVPEFFGRDPYATSAFLLARTSRIQIATGIANVYSHDAIVAAQNRQTLAELSDGRFVLGLGVSHPPMAEAHGLEWLPPVKKMRAYLETIDGMKIQSPAPAEPAPIWIAAHGPLLLKLAGEHADGANTYLMPPPHTKNAREIVGPDFRLNLVLPCCLCDDPEVGRKMGRKALSIYLPLPAYQNAWKKWGFASSDFENGGSDHLIDSVVAWGDVAKIRDRIAEHRDAGAPHIVLSALNPEARGPSPHWKLYEALAP